jgi:surface antigen
MKHTFGLLVMLGAISFAVPAMAQINPFKNNRTGANLSATDLDLLGSSIDKLNRDPKLATGASEKWSNPATGSYGTSTVTKVFEQGHTPCHTMHHDVFTQGKSPARGYDLTWCRTAKGQWRVKS